MVRFLIPDERGCFEIPDQWWIEAGMNGFTRALPSYITTPDPDVLYVALKDITCPNRTVERDFRGFERDRLLRIFGGFLAGDAIPPVKVHKCPYGPSSYGLRDGFHRFHASIAAGFSCIPVALTTYLPE